MATGEEVNKHSGERESETGWRKKDRMEKENEEKKIEALMRRLVLIYG